MSSHRPLLVSIFILTVALGGCERFKSPEDLIRDAQRLHQKGDDAAAVIQLKSALQKNPDLFEARNLLGVSYNETGNYADAEKELRAALRLRNNEPAARAALGRALLGQGEFKKALEELSVPTNANTATSAELRALTGMAKLGAGAKTDAAQDFDEARKLLPNQVDALLGQARLAAIDGQVGEALKLTDEALQIAPRNKEAGLLKATLLHTSGKLDKALSAYKAVLAIDQRNVPAHVGLISLYLDQKNKQAAHEQTARARKLVPDNVVLLLMQGQMSLREQKFAEARDAALEVLKAAPDYLQAEYLLGVAHLALGAYEQAIKSLGLVVGKAPRNELARVLLANAQLNQHQPQKALETLKPILDAGSENEKVLSTAGQIYLQLNQPTKATHYFELAVKAKPESTTLRTELAFARLAGGDREQGIADLQVAAADPNASRADFALIATYLREGKFDDALKAIDQLEKKQPTSPVPHYLRGKTYTAKRQLDLARKSYEKAASLDAAYVPAALALANLDLQNKDRAAAKRRFEMVFSKDKDSLAALVALASIATQDKNDAEALTLLQRAVKAHPATLEPHTLLVQYHLAKKHPDKAVAVAKQFQAANPNLNDALNLLGNTQEAAGEKQNAIATFTQLAQKAPDSPEVLLRLAQAHRTAGNLEEVRRTLMRALAMRPGHFGALSALYRLESQAKRYDEAKKVAQQVQKNHPQSPEGFVMQGDLELVLRQFPQAIKSYEAAAALGRSGQLTIRLHQAYLAVGQRAQADAKILSWLKEFPNDKDTRFYLAQIYLGAGQDKQAIEQFETLLKADPDNVIVLNNLAWLYQKTNDPRALNTAEHAHKLKPDAAVVMDTLGWILVQQGNTARGLGLLEKAHAASKDNLEVKFHYASALVKAGNKSKAKLLLGELSKGKPFPQQDEAKRLLATL